MIKMFRERMHHGMMRERAYNLKEIVDFLGINKDWDVADLGAGDGYFSKEFLKYARSVTAIDIDIDCCSDELKEMGIKTIKADLCKYSVGKYHLLFMANVYHGLRRSCRESILNNMAKMSLKYIAILDFNEKRLFGPPFRVKKEEVIDDFLSVGFKVVKIKDLEFHYLILFEKS